MCANEKESSGTDCRSKRQRDDISAAFPLHSGEQQINSSSSQHENSGGIPGQPADSSMSFAGGGGTPSSYVHVDPGSVVTTTSPGLGGFPADGSSLQSTDFKQENQVTSVSCDEQTSAGQSNSCSNEAGGQSGQSPSKYAGTYLAQELSDFERVFQGYKKAAEEKRTSDALTLNINQGQENGTAARKIATGPDAEQNQRMPNSQAVHLTNRQPQRLQDFTHEPSLALTSPVTQGRTAMFGDGQAHSQYSEHQQAMDDHQDIARRPPFQTDLFSPFGNTSQLLPENVQGYPVANQPMPRSQNDSHLFQRTSHNSQQNMYSFSQQQGMSSKLSHPPLKGQHRASFPPFQNTQGLSPSMGRAGAASGGPMSAQDLPRLPGAMYTSSQLQQKPIFQRQQSVPSGPRQPFLGVEPLQQDIQPFPTSDQHLLPNAPGLQASYHYQRRNSYPLYQRNSMPIRGFPQNSQQMNSPTNGFQNSVPKFGPPVSMPSGPRLQPVNPYQGVRASADISHPSHAFSSAIYNSQSRQDIVTSLPQVTHAGRKPNPGSVYPYHGNSSTSVRSAVDTGQSSLVTGSLVKAPSFASLLEQSPVNQGNLGTTYTGSIPNLELLTEILGP